MATTVSHPIPSAQAQAIADLTGYEDAATLRWQQACVQAANTLTALPNCRYVNVRMERMRQGLELAQRGAVTLPEDGEQLSAVVRSGHNVYQVDTRLLTCTCARCSGGARAGSGAHDSGTEHGKLADQRSTRLAQHQAQGRQHGIHADH